MHGLGLFYALMESLGGRSTPPNATERPSEPVEPLDEATYDAWEAWARSERRRWTDPVGPIAPTRHEAPARHVAPPLVRPPERAVLGRI